MHISSGERPSSRLAPADIHTRAEITERLRGRLQSLLAESGYAGNAQAFFEAVATRARAPRTRQRRSYFGFYAQLKVTRRPRRCHRRSRRCRRPTFSFGRWRRSVPATRPRCSPIGRRTGAPCRSAVRRHGDTAAGSPDRAAFLREALPGHHLQLAVQEERSRLAWIPSPSAAIRVSSRGGDSTRSRSARSSACTATPRRNSRASRTSWPVPPGSGGRHRACTRLGWSREQALDYLRAQVPTSEEAANETIDRIIALPAEALDCGMGLRVFRALRSPRAAGARCAFRSARLSRGADRRRRHAARHSRVRREPLVERPALISRAFRSFSALRAASRRLAVHREPRPPRAARRRAGRRHRRGVRANERDDQGARTP